MNRPATIIEYEKPVCLLHPWDRRRIARTLRRRSTVLFRVGVGLFLTSGVAFIAAAPLWVLQASLVAILAACVILGRAFFLASIAAKYDV